ncbi:RE2 [Symbiodinium sp. CCMP2592]|nr:RE2 [Symbiodinium sp. CCMP2592]
MALLEGLSWQKFMEISENECTEGKYGIPRFDGSVHLLQEYSYRVKMKELREKELEPSELKKLGPLGLRLVEGLRGPALHIVKRIDQTVLASDKGAAKILSELAETLRPRRTQEARELYLAGAKEGGPLSRQFGEPMSIYVLRRRSWWSMLQDLDSEIKLPDLILAEQTLQNARISEDHALMIRTSLAQVITMNGVCSELVNQHGSIHLKEKRDRAPQPWRPRFSPGHGKGHTKNKGKGHGYFAWEEAGEDQTEQAFYGDGFSWETASQSLGGYEDELAGAYQAEGHEVDYAEHEDPILQVFAAMVSEGFDETTDLEGGEYAADVIQAESEAYVARQMASNQGHAGFAGKRFEFRGEMSLEERKARVQALKQRTTCRKCGQKGHWSTDPQCPKGSAKGGGKRGHSSAASSSSQTTVASPAGKGKTKKGPPKPRTVYFAVKDEDHGENQAYMAYRRVPPPTSLDERPASAPTAPNSLSGVAPPSAMTSGPMPGTLSSLLRGSGAAASSSSTLPAATSTDTTSEATSRQRAAEEPGPNWQVVPGQDWDHAMLFQALQANSDVVIDQMISAARAMDTTEPLPIEPGQAALPDVGELRPPALQEMPGLLVPGDEQESLSDFSLFGGEPEATAAEQRPPLNALGGRPPEQPPPETAECAHVRTTTKGTNAHSYRRTCLDCGKILEVRKKEKEEPPPAAGALRDPDGCPHTNVSRQGTNSHVWKWRCRQCGLSKEGRQSQHSARAMGLGALGTATLDGGVDTAAVKVLEMAGTVVMVQESGGLAVPLSRLPEIVQKCTEIYLRRAAGQNMAPGSSQPAAPPPPQPRPQPLREAPRRTEAAPPKAAGASEPTGITDDALLHSGKYKGSTYRDVFYRYPDYVDWVLSQGGNLQAKSLVDFHRYALAKKREEHEDHLLAVLDTGCNQTCHGSDWLRSYCRASGVEPTPLEETEATGLNGIGGKVRSVGKRTFTITLQLQDGTLAEGTVESIELAGSTAPLLLSCRAQKQMGLVLDLEEGTAFSKKFGRHLEVVDRDGLPAVRLLPLQDPAEPAGQEHFAMSAIEEEEDGPRPADEKDFWQYQDGGWIRTHINSRSFLFDPRREPTEDPEIDAEVCGLPFRRTVAIGPHGGLQNEFRDHWLNLETENVEEYQDGPWTGYTYFTKGPPEQTTEEPGKEVSLYAAFDEEAAARRVLTKGQKRHLAESADAALKKDAAMWSQLVEEPSYHNVKRLLPKGCRSFLLEFFAGAAAVTLMASSLGLPTSVPVDFHTPQGDLTKPEVRQQLWDYVETEDPYLMVIAPTGLPWSRSPARRNRELQEERKHWYPVAQWLSELIRHRVRKGRQVALGSSWGSWLWELRCFREAYGEEDPITNQNLEVISFDRGAMGSRDCRSGRVCRLLSGMMTTSLRLKTQLCQVASPGPATQAGKVVVPMCWPPRLCDTVIKAAYVELQDLHCAVAFAAEDGLEEAEEFGLLDAVGPGEEPPPLPEQAPPEELQRQEHLEETTPTSEQPVSEKERRAKWLGISRNQRLAIRRLHHMTGHASNEAMMRMLRSAGSSPNTVAACRHFRCQVCLDKQEPTRPRSVAEPPVYKFNHQIECDAFEIRDAAGQKHTILSVVDSGTRFHVAGWVAPGGTPTSRACAEFLNTAWFSWAGAPRIFSSDQGVHNRGHVAALLRANGVEIKMAGVKAPWQIGRAERHGGILKAMMKRVIAMGHLTGEFAIKAVASQCAATKNSSFVHAGFAPSQWVLGRIPYDGTSLVQESAQEQLGTHQAIVDQEDQFGKNLLIRQWAKEAYVYVDASQRVRRAMLRQSHPVRGPYHAGDLVSYHRRGKWHGPARVLGPEGRSSLWIVHETVTWDRAGGRHKRKYEEFLEDVEEDLPFSRDIPVYAEGEETAANQVPFFDFVTASSPAVPAPPSPGETQEPVQEAADFPTTAPERQTTQPEQEPLEEQPGPTTSGENPTTSTSLGSPGPMLEDQPPPTTTSAENPTTSTSTGVPLSNLQEAMHRSVDALDGVPLSSRSARSRSPPSRPQANLFSAPPGLVQSEVPAATDGPRERQARQDKEKAKKAVAFLVGRTQKAYKKKTVKKGAGRELVYNRESAGVQSALDASRRKEWDNWKGYTNMKKITRAEFDEMKKSDPGLRIIPTRWVDTDKSEDGQPMKAKSRFVVRGDMEDARGMRSGDISAAFLQGSVLDRSLVLSMPKGAPPYDMEEGDLVMVSTTVYGTKDAPRGWFKKLDGSLRNKTLRRVPMEPGFYVLNGNRKDGTVYIRGALIIHVDDILWCGDEEMDRIMTEIQNEYKFGSLDSGTFKYCGRILSQTEKGISVTCPDLITRVKPIPLDQRRKGQRDASATEAERAQLRSVTGSLNWLVRVCRPDMAYGVAKLQTAVNHPKVQDLLEANALVKFAQRTKDVGLYYRAGALRLEEAMLVAIQDASYAADFDVSASGKKLGYRSQSGRILCLAPRSFATTLEGHLYPVEWHSTVIRRVCKSTLQAESLSLQLGSVEAEHARSVLHGLYEEPPKLDATAWVIGAQDRCPVMWVTDCMSLLTHLLNPAAGTVGDKRLAIDLCSLRQELWRRPGEYVGDPLGHDRPPLDPSTCIVWTSTDKMLADGLTKKIVAHEPMAKLMKGERINLAPTLDQKNSTGVKAQRAETEITLKDLDGTATTGTSASAKAGKSSKRSQKKSNRCLCF